MGTGVDWAAEVAPVRLDFRDPAFCFPKDPAAAAVTLLPVVAGATG